MHSAQESITSIHPDSYEDTAVNRTIPRVVHIDIPNLGVAEIEPDHDNIREFIKDKAADRGLDIPEHTVNSVKFLQNPQALGDHISLADEEEFQTLSPLVQQSLKGLALAHRLSPPAIKDYFLSAMPLNGSAMYLNTPKVVGEAVREVGRYNAQASENLTMTGINQFLNFHLEQSIDNWLNLSDPRIGSRMANFAKTFGPNVVPLLATKAFTGVLPVTLLLNNSDSPEKLAKSILIVGTFAGLTQTGVAISKKLNSPSRKEAEYLKRPMFDIRF